MKDTRSITKPSFSIGTALAVLAAATGMARGQCDTPTWLPTEGVPGVHGSVGFTNARVKCSIMWDPDGAGPLQPRLVIGGEFLFAGDVVARNIAMWDGVAWQALGPGLRARPIDLGDTFEPERERDWYGTVNALAVLPNGELVAAGFFTETAMGEPGQGTPLGDGQAQDPLSGETYGHVARWDGASWHAMGIGVKGNELLGLAVRPNGHVIVTGVMTEVNGSTIARGIARWNGTTWSAINQGLRVGTDPGAGYAIASLPDGDLVVAGSFATAGPVPAANIARLHFAANGTTSTWSALGSGVADGSVVAIDALPSGEIIVGGSFTDAGGASALNVARWNGTAWSALGAGLDVWSVADLAHADNGDLLAAGSVVVGSRTLPVLSRWNGVSWQNMGDPSVHFPSSSSGLTVAVTTGGDIALGAEGSAGVVRWNGSGWSHFNAGFDEAIHHVIEMPNGDVVVSGGFSQAGLAVCSRIARYDGTTWSPLGLGLDGIAELVAMPNGDVIASGAFTQAGGASISRFARWDGSSWTQLPLAPVTGSVSNPILMPNGDIVGIGPDHAGVGAYMTLYRFNGTSWTQIPGVFDHTHVAFNQAGPHTVIALPNGDLIVGGHFTTIDGEPFKNVARWNGTVWSELGAGLGMFDGDFVDALEMENVGQLAVLSNGDIMAAAGFVRIIGTGELTKSVALWNGTTWTNASAGALGSPGAGVHQMVPLTNGDVIGIGRIYTNGYPDGSSLARYDGTTWVGVPGTEWNVATSQIHHSAKLLTNGNIAVVGAFSAVGNNFPSAHFAVFGCENNACPSDFDGDGFVTGDDFDGYVAAFELGDIAADFDHDGFVTGDDFDAYVLAFEAGC